MFYSRSSLIFEQPLVEIFSSQVSAFRLRPSASWQVPISIQQSLVPHTVTVSHLAVMNMSVYRIRLTDIL